MPGKKKEKMSYSAGGKTGSKKGGYTTIQDMERACGSMTVTESAKGRPLK